jgi:hypothetical protein
MMCSMGHYRPGSEVHGSDLSQRLGAESAGERAGGVVYDRASRLSDPFAGDGQDGTAFRRAADRFADENKISVV